MTKLEFLQTTYLELLSQIDESTKPLFGKMNAHQMIEHMGYSFQQASGLIQQDALNDEETTEKMYRFMMSDKPFRENTPNPYLPDEPLATQTKNISEALNSLRKDISKFVDTYSNETELRHLNPFFGNLNFEEWTHLLHKHAWHHLKQFGINPTNL
jgi:hypothetical protein